MRRPDSTPHHNGIGPHAPPYNLLAVSFAYPPSALPRAVQVSRLLKNLRTRTTLVCAHHDEKGVRKDQTLVEESEAFLAHCIRVPFEHRGVNSLMSRVAYRLHLPVIDKVPDHFRSWKPAVMHAVDSFCRARNYVPDVIATFGFPMTDHLIGLELKRRLDVPWVAHFSDPWVDNPFRREDSLTRWLNLSLENRVLEVADRVIFTSEETLELVMSKYDSSLRRKARVLAHSYDADQFPPRLNGKDGQLMIRYLGDLYPPRSPEPLFRAVAKMCNEPPLSDCNVRFEIIGQTYDFNLDAMGLRALPEGIISLKPSVKYLDSLALMANSDGLLVIDAPADISVFLPSKLIDYVGAGRPILGITPPGTAADLIGRLGGWVADPKDVPGIADALKTFIAFLHERRDTTAAWGDADVRRGFAAATVSQEFECILDELIEEQGKGAQTSARS
jgi:glycosyltransferase involved in cell wall biosynthesis